MFSARRVGLQATEKKTPPLRTKRLKSSLSAWCISGCCGTHLITVARIESKERMCFCGKSRKIWAQTVRCFHIKNRSDRRHHRQVVLRRTGEAVFKTGFPVVSSPSQSLAVLLLVTLRTVSVVMWSLQWCSRTFWTISHPLNARSCTQTSLLHCTFTRV